MFTVQIYFKDHTTITIGDVDDVKINLEYDMFFVCKETHKIMIPRDIVKMIGYPKDFDRGLKGTISG